MTFEEFKINYQKKPVEEYPNNCHKRPALVTVKVVAYNHAPYIRQCLESILMQQTDCEFDILIAEDESSDGTREICLEYAEKFPDRIRLLLNSRENNIHTNGKPSGLFNSVYANFLINTKYMAICEADDYWCDSKSLAKKVQFLEHNDDYVMAFSNFNRLIADTNTMHVRPAIKWKKNKSVSQGEILKANIPTVSNVFRNGLLEKFDEKMRDILLGDLMLKGKLSQYGKAYYISEIEPEVYRLHQSGIFSTFNRPKQADLTISSLKYLLDYYEQKNQDDKHIRKFLIYFCMHTFLRTAFVNRQIEFRLIKIATKYSSQKFDVIREGLVAMIEIINNLIYISFKVKKIKTHLTH